MKEKREKNTSLTLAQQPPWRRTRHRPFPGAHRPVHKWETHFPKKPSAFLLPSLFRSCVLCSRVVPGPDSHVNVGLFSFLIRFPRRDVRYSYHWRLSSSSFWLVLKEQLWHGSRNSSVPSPHFHWLLPTGSRRTRVIRIIRPKSYRQKQSRLLSNESQQLATKWTRVQCKHFVIDYFWDIMVGFRDPTTQKFDSSTGKRWARNLHVRNTNRASRCEREWRNSPSRSAV